MRIALLTDIHGNREALTACLEHVRRSDVESYRQSLARRMPGKPGE